MHIYTDGSSSGNPGPGGWGVVLLDSIAHTVRELGGGVKNATNNQMELLAAIYGIEALRKKSSAHLYTDSMYVVDGMNKWIWTWQKNNWHTSTKKPVANQDLWKRLLDLVSHHTIHWKHVKAHQGIPGNERADRIAFGFSQGRSVSLFEGSCSEYPIVLF